MAPPVAFFTSSANRRQLITWKLASGQTVASGSFIAACARTIPGAMTSAPTPAFNAVLRPSFIAVPQESSSTDAMTVDWRHLRCNSQAKPPKVYRGGNSSFGARTRPCDLSALPWRSGEPSMARLAPAGAVGGPACDHGLLDRRIAAGGRHLPDGGGRARCRVFPWRICRAFVGGAGIAAFFWPVGRNGPDTLGDVGERADWPARHIPGRGHHVR